MLLEGKVVKVTKGSIHVLVLGFASAIITEEDIRDEFVYKIKHEEEVFSSKFHKRRVIKVGTMIRFVVKSLDEEILHISGSLIPAHTGCIRWLARHLEDGTVTDRSKKKKIENEVESILEDHGTLSAEELSVNDDCRIKKSKKGKRPNAES